MTPHRDWFCTYEPVLEGSVFMGNDHALEIVGIGTVKIKMFDAEGNWYEKPVKKLYSEITSIIWDNRYSTTWKKYFDLIETPENPEA